MLIQGLAAGTSLGLTGANPGNTRAAQAAATPVASSETRPPNPDNLMIRVGDIDIAYRVLGQGEPLLMIVGSASTMDLWDPTLLEELAARYLLILFDNRGIGGTTGTGPFTFNQMADDTAGLIAALGLGPTNVLGWSMGGSITLDLSIRHPESVKKVVLYAANCGGAKAIPPSREALAALTATGGSREEQGQRLLDFLLPPAWITANLPYVTRIFSRPMEPTSPEALEWQRTAIGAWAGVFEQLPEMGQPALIVTGTDDLITPPGNATLLANEIPGSWLIRLAGAGHGAMYQEPKRLAALVSLFLDG